MRTTINRNTISNVFGIGQDRDVVTVRGVRGTSCDALRDVACQSTSAGLV